MQEADKGSPRESFSKEMKTMNIVEPMSPLSPARVSNLEKQIIHEDSEEFS